VLNELINHAKEKMQDRKVDLAAFFGNIEEIGKTNLSRVADAQGTVNDDIPLEVSVPIGTIRSDKKYRSGDFLLFRLDLGRYRHLTNLFGLLGFSCFGLFSVLLVATMATTDQQNVDLIKEKKELQEAFKRIGGVLRDAPMPYILLDPTDKIRDCNKSFAEFLGIDISRVMGLRFRDLIAESYKIKYDVVQNKRADNEEVQPYLMAFTTASGEKEVWVSAAAVPPTSENAHKRVPETFGVLLSNKPDSAMSPVERQPKKGSDVSSIQ
jgi:PAS domain S-box-containing protein